MTASRLRLIAARIIDDVTNGHSLSDLLAPSLKNINDSRDRAFVQALCYGVCRYYSRLDVILSHLLKKPMKAKDSDVHALLLVGLYQLTNMRVPPHAAVTETVNASEGLNKPWARGLLNAILREYLRRKESIDANINEDIESEYAHPQWWIAAIKTAWPHHWQTILTANNDHPPFALRVNQQKITREQYIEKLKQNGFIAEMIPETHNGIILESPISAEELPGFALGEVSVQDGAAQFAAEWLDLTPNQRVLDACAAPGGKLMHILECEPHLAACIAIEKNKERMQPIKENIARLFPQKETQPQCVCADVADTKTWWDGKLFDRILLDAPCSASGVIRRHPDIKLLRQPTDIKPFAEEQFHLLEALWPLLCADGILMYVTCSIFPEENVQVLQRFLTTHADAKEEEWQVDWGVPCDIGRQILPGMHRMDGFYYARLRKL